MADWIQAIIYLLVAILLLRFAGKRTISQATPSEVVIMIGLGTVLVHPLKSEYTWLSVYHGGLIVGGVIIISLLQMAFPSFKRFVMGEPILLVKNGEIISKNLKRARVPEDELKMKLRMKKINDITMLKSVTLEVSGNLGIEIEEKHSYATKKDIADLKKAIEMIGNKVGTPVVIYNPSTNQDQNLFRQVEEIQEKDPIQ
ncbi:DUF421 domain-containing protein [Aquibacillus salsiterrae]|uniref:DUF421 domain-containing protein n=1 Tax=Aquibacillus salsiterrae TaxID=2950439 RepID=A0A9X4AFR2_9BACI|nr:YetF domain-containing protein [Aquibacillus salsiterrae]MDC3418181.1 DUF421 domain-containing protein [Aquibacillus salsiterrae]